MEWVFKSLFYFNEKEFRNEAEQTFQIKPDFLFVRNVFFIAKIRVLMAKVSILALGNKAELTLSCALSASGLISQLAGLVAVKLA